MGFGAVALIGLALFGVARARHRPTTPHASTGLTVAQNHDKAAAAAWQPKVTAAFRPVVSSLSGFVGDTQHWSEGSLDDGDFRARTSAVLKSFVEGRDSVTAVPPFSVDRRANDLYRRSALLYEQSARVELVAVDTPAGDLRLQLRTLGQRLRELADRVYDRAGVIVAGALHQTPDPNVVINLPEEVPIWTAEGLATGPPLDDSVAAGPVGLPPQRQANRPSEPRPKWRSAVAALEIPTARDVAAAIDHGTAVQLRDLARRLVAAAESLRRQPDPSGDREGGITVRLGLLVDADSARAAQASRLLPAGVDRDHLTLVAQRLALVSDGLWATDLAARRSGFPVGILDAPA
jgi:hypothetical protein